MSIFYNNFAKELKKEDLEFNKDIEEYKMYINNGKKLAINYINCMASCLYVTGTINIMKVKFDDLLNLIPDDVAIEVFNYYYAYKEEYFTKDNNEDILYIRTFLANLVDFAFFYTSYNKIEFKLFDDDVIDKRTIASSIYVFKENCNKYGTSDDFINECIFLVTGKYRKRIKKTEDNNKIENNISDIKKRMIKPYEETNINKMKTYFEKLDRLKFR